MKFMLFVLPTVPGTLEDRKRLRPIGRNNERYQQMLDELRQLAQFADDVGFDVMATTEHHFHSEGYETSVAPLLLYADLAARTKRIKFSPLGLVLPSWDPIRAAEEIVLVINKAWTEEAWDYDGDYCQVPYPYKEGIRRWPVADWSRSYGAPGEIDEAGVVRKICVVPKPYQLRHPPMFQPFSVSETTIRYTAQSGIVPWILVANPPDFKRLCHVYQDVAATAGRKLRLGESVGAFRAVHFGNTEAEAVG